MIERHVLHDGEDPRSKRGAPLKLSQTPVHDQEHVLRSVIASGSGHSQSTQRPPHERKLLLVDAFELRLKRE